MRKYLFARLLALCVAIALSCACHDETGLGAKVIPTTVKLKVSVPVSETKLTGTITENAIDNYQVYVFSENGVLETYVNQSDSDIVLSCTAGDKTIAVLANAPVVNDITTFSELSSKTTMLTDNDTGCFVMSGKQQVTLSGDKEVSVAVSRLVAKVRLSELNVSFEAPQYQSAGFKVSAVYLINVPADVSYFSGASPVGWYNKQKYISSDSNVLTYDDMRSVMVTSDNPYSSVNTFYCYPNPVTQDSFDPTWTERHTRLVVEASIGIVKYYYPVTLPALESNKIYDVRLAITRPGVSGPDMEVEKYAADFSISVMDWETGASVSKEI